MFQSTQKAIQSIHTIQNNGDLINPSDSAYAPENKHDNGKATIGKCISHWKLAFFIASVSFQEFTTPNFKNHMCQGQNPWYLAWSSHH